MYSLHQALQDALPLIERELRLDRLSADEHAVGLLASANQEVFAWLPYPAPSNTDVDNQRSQRALEKLGAHCDGMLRRDLRRPDGIWRDSIYYSVLRTEWPVSQS